MEIVTIAGVVLGVLVIFGGALLEGLGLGAIFQATAAIIVFGGTAGAVMVSYPIADIRRALKMVRELFKTTDLDVRLVIEELISVATVARKEGVLALEPMRETLQDPLFKKSIKYVIDGFEPQTVKDIMAAEIEIAFEEEESAAKVWESAGGYAPAVGTLGAVLSLIQVLASMNAPGSDLGGGIAAAFVATIYGVGASNLFFIPFATKLKRRAFLRANTKEVVRLGVLGIQEGVNPNSLREKLQVYVSSQPAPQAADSKPAELKPEVKKE